MIYLRLEEIGENSGAIQFNRKSIATFFLWAMRIEILNESQRFDWQSDITRYRLLELWDRIHLANPAPAAIYLDALLSYFDVDSDRVTEYPGSEQGARAASLCLLRVLSGVDQTSMMFENIRKRYVTVVPPDADFEGLPCYHTISAIHAVLVGRRKGWSFSWTDYHPCTQEHVFFANALVQVAHKGRRHGKVPRWILRFVIHSLSKDPPSPAPVVIDCLLIVAIDLGCEIPEGNVGKLDERYACPVQLHSSPC